MGMARAQGEFIPPLSSISSKSVNKISESCNRSWKATRDPRAPSLSLGLLLCFLIAWHWLTQHPGETFTLQPTEASWDRNTTIYFLLAARRNSIWHTSCTSASGPCALQQALTPGMAVAGMGRMSQSPPCSSRGTAIRGAWCSEVRQNKTRYDFFCSCSPSTSLLRAESAHSVFSSACAEAALFWGHVKPPS